MWGLGFGVLGLGFGVWCLGWGGGGSGLGPGAECSFGLMLGLLWVLRTQLFVAMVGVEFRVLVEGCSLNYHNNNTIVFTIDPYHGNINYIPQQEPRIGLGLEP